MTAIMRFADAEKQEIDLEFAVVTSWSGNIRLPSGGATDVKIRIEAHHTWTGTGVLGWNSHLGCAESLTLKGDVEFTSIITGELGRSDSFAVHSNHSGESLVTLTTQ